MLRYVGVLFLEVVGGWQQFMHSHCFFIASADSVGEMEGTSGNGQNSDEELLESVSQMSGESNNES